MSFNNASILIKIHVYMMLNGCRLQEHYVFTMLTLGFSDNTGIFNLKFVRGIMGRIVSPFHHVQDNQILRNRSSSFSLSLPLHVNDWENMKII